MTLSQRLAAYVRACFTGLWLDSHEHDDDSSPHRARPQRLLQLLEELGGVGTLGTCGAEAVAGLPARLEAVPACRGTCARVCPADQPILRMSDLTLVMSASA